MKKLLTVELAKKMLPGEKGSIITEFGVDFFQFDGEQYTLDGEWSYFIAIPLIEVDFESEEEFEELWWGNLPDFSVELGYPLREDADEEGEWDAQYDLDSPRLLHIGSRLPKDLDEQ